MICESSALKSKLIDMMAWFHAFCQENNLRYYVLGGTMLGAVRHHGFIPWDDDIDVGMPRSDYERLEKLLSDKKAGKYILETPNTDAPDYFYPFSKLYDTTTTLIENTKYKIKRGIYLDIFPLDGIGNSLEEGLKNYAAVHKKRSLLLIRIGGIRKGRSFYKNLTVMLFRLIPNAILNNKRILHGLTETCRKYDFDTCEWWGNLVGAYWSKEVMPKQVLGEPTLYAFENLFVYGPADADGYLTALYGDWRKLPPEDKRVSHHDFILCDLQKSYLD